MVELQALRPLHGNYGTVRRGQKFRCTEDIAQDLESRGLARRPVVETKMLVAAPENKVAAASPAGSKLQALIAERRRSSQAAHR